MATMIAGRNVDVDQIRGDVLVISGGDLTLRGQIDGTLAVRSGGTAHVLGQVTNLVIELGATIQMDGMVIGTLTDLR